MATHPSDMAVALAALDAIVHVESATGSRTIPLTELHRLPGEEPQRDTILEQRGADRRGRAAAASVCERFRLSQGA